MMPSTFHKNNEAKQDLPCLVLVAARSLPTLRAPVYLILPRKQEVTSTPDDKFSRKLSFRSRNMTLRPRHDRVSPLHMPAILVLGVKMKEFIGENKPRG